MHVVNNVCRHGKTTLLKHISSRVLNIPPNIDILLCEQGTQVLGRLITATVSSSFQQLTFACLVFLFTHAGCIVASVCLFVRALKGKLLELSTSNVVHIYS